MKFTVFRHPLHLVSWSMLIAESLYESLIFTRPRLLREDSHNLGYLVSISSIQSALESDRQKEYAGMSC